MPVKASTRRRGNLKRTTAAKFLNTFQPSRHIRNGVSTIALFYFRGTANRTGDLERLKKYLSANGASAAGS